jgi:hypothetical protein
MWFSSPEPEPRPRKVLFESRLMYTRSNGVEDDDQLATIDTESIEWPDKMWLVVGAISTLIVAWNDGLVLTTGLWLVGMIAYGQVVFPWLQHQARHGFLRIERLYVGVMLGWAIVAGPVAGAIIGPLAPFMTDTGCSSFVGGILGLLACPPFAAVEGVVIVGLVDVVVWLWTGKSLQSRWFDHGA